MSRALVGISFNCGFQFPAVAAPILSVSLGPGAVSGPSS
jgi:hypothetical protein